jgi:hypothetical protein
MAGGPIKLNEVLKVADPHPLLPAARCPPSCPYCISVLPPTLVPAAAAAADQYPGQPFRKVFLRPSVGARVAQLFASLSRCPFWACAKTVPLRLCDVQSFSGAFDIVHLESPLEELLHCLGWPRRVATETAAGMQSVRVTDGPGLGCSANAARECPLCMDCDDGAGIVKRDQILGIPRILQTAAGIRPAAFATILLKRQ